MRVVLKGKNSELTPALRVYIDQKITRPARKYLGIKKSDEANLLELEVGRSTQHHRKGKVWYAEANLSMGKKLLRASKSAEDARQAIDLIETELLREIRRFKEKRKTKAIRGARKIKRIMKRRSS
jgi:putative sigma-54 modulation protein